MDSRQAPVNMVMNLPVYAFFSYIEYEGYLQIPIQYVLILKSKAIIATSNRTVALFE
jgi:hypothetical protein